MSASSLVKAASHSRHLYRAVVDHLNHIDQIEEDDMTDEDMRSVNSGDEEPPEADAVCMDDDTHDLSKALRIHEKYIPPDEPLDGLDRDMTADDERIVADRMSNLPPELGVQIVRNLAFEDQIRMLRVSTSNASLVGDALREKCSRMLEQFHLRFDVVRLLQTATRLAITGSAIAILLHPEPGYEPGDLDIITPHGGGWDVLRFLENTPGRYLVAETHPTYTHARGIGIMWTLKGRANKKINVIESLTDNPLDAITFFHSTCVIGAWVSNGIWHAYPKLTIDGLSISTPPRMAVTDDLTTHQHVWTVLRKYRDRGFSFAFDDYDVRHECGRDLNCPATIRRSDDAGCMFARFPEWHFTMEEKEFAHASVWSMGGSGCCHRGILRLGQRSGRPANKGDVARWVRQTKYLYDLPAKPEIVNVW
ncbi:hypothetical protein C8F04DRAFT_1184542 [Mycena alexandri]|uniref:F-box domain-containing protein n=1 Tax=Mycena alexandri TaxID=1745969 RepID=A0AAD6X228_9AGAR|nr:hypothetical protein C8F04DRAFT_1184542 [Mycena alexandri]